MARKLSGMDSGIADQLQKAVSAARCSGCRKRNARIAELEDECDLHRRRADRWKQRFETCEKRVAELCHELSAKAKLNGGS